MNLDNSEITLNSIPLTFRCCVGLFGLICLIAALTFLCAAFLPKCFVPNHATLDQVGAPYGY